MSPEKPQQTEPLAVSAKEAWRLLSIGQTTFYALLKAGKIETLTVGRKRLVKYASLKKFVEADHVDVPGDYGR
jgi:excisionase family DNA binding protein